MKNGFALRELDDLFHEAVALSGSDRLAFLDRLCRTRPDLFRELLQMLDADAQSDALLDHVLPASLGGVQSRDCIGRWRLIEPIGEGGLGVVYRASCEADGVTLHAALKILRAGFDRGVFHRRFIEERNILSGIDHPYIARLIDAGADPGGDSFLAIEFVPGQPLDQYLAESSSPLRERLELFMRICEAVEYLHGNGIVHGDIKPSNVMVKLDGTPKLLDFGTARLIARGELSASEISRLIMTPGYASPEQKAGLGSSMLGDVYSLGCVLRDILAHAAPPPDVCAIRDRCLSPSPPGRYQSPGEVSDDVRRFFDHSPVRARPASGWYVSAKFLRRNRTGCGLAAIAVLSLVIGGLVSRHNARRADHYARQNRSVITHLLQDPPAAQSPESTQRAAFAATIHDAIAQMESLTPPPLAQLTTAWRRLSYTQAARGETAQSKESIGRSIDYARRNRAAGDTPVTQAELAESLLYAALLQIRRGDRASGGGYAVEAIRLIEGLPAASRGVIMEKPYFLRALSAAARQQALAGHIQGGRNLLARGLEQSRSLGTSLQLRMLLDLASFERRAGNAGQAGLYCREAQALEPAHPRLRIVCAQGARSTNHNQSTTTLIQKITRLEKRLVHDPEKFGDRQQLARLKLRLGRTATQSGDSDRAGRLLEEARVLAQALLEADPENSRVRHLARSIARAGAELAPGSSPDPRARAGRVRENRRPWINSRAALTSQTMPER